MNLELSLMNQERALKQLRETHSLTKIQVLGRKIILGHLPTLAALANRGVMLHNSDNS